MSIHNRKTIILLSAAVIVTLASALAFWLLLSEKVGDFNLRDDFEEGLGNWTIDAEVPEDPNNPGQPVSWSIKTSQDQASSGSQSVLFAIDGSQDDGAIWIQRKLDSATNRIRTLNLTFKLWSPSESFNTIAAVIIYVGNKEPNSESDFHVLGQANQAEGWKIYSIQPKLLTRQMKPSMLDLKSLSGGKPPWNTS